MTDQTDQLVEQHRGLRAMTLLTIVTLVGSGLVAGVFFTFSTFVMAGLKRLPAQQAGAAMQSINITAVRPPLMILLFGTALACVVVAVGAWRSWNPGSPWLIAGAVIYLVGAIVVTAAANVPLNDKLAAMDPAAAATYWPDYLRNWLPWNHVRTLASTAAAVSFAVALFRQAGNS